MGRTYISLARQYADMELQLIYDYLENAHEVSERELAHMITANRSRPSQVR